ncbi:hypothetical protein GCM10010112_22490 [Actinoplanes lobatus]|uniref:Integral membrane protein n=1 Tax=Actinoplanes lobatus TaxID=113568 RepID=A0A7W7MI90_9ACTN|nr:hypothetical protein [Actinoplanes lobatus]MBB4751292.1 hypothetical protein [Actinoplanes lobatus]GGN63328.1 hypothetical protein GCM10010112_22490 [Actinoplanes lobatus]GIE44766.1 hypothetical protein Alo02nite_76640 [Actinoplanes lobatus]
MRVSDQIPATARVNSNALLRWTLRADALVTGANGVAYLALAGVLTDVLGYPVSVQHAVGAFLAVFAIVVGVIATRPVLSRAAVRAVIAVNVAWVLLSIVVLGTGAVEATTLGRVWMAAQAAVVAALAAIQGYALRSR